MKNTFCVSAIAVGMALLLVLLGINGVQAAVQQEQEVTITGKITVIQIDDFKDAKNSHLKYYIDTPQKRYSFQPASDFSALSGTTVKISGYTAPEQLTTKANQKFNQNSVVKLSKLGPITKLDNGPKIQAVGNQRTLVLLIKSFAGDGEPFTPAQGRELVFNDQFQKFMREQSYGKVSFSGDVFGWYALGHPISCFDSSYEPFPSRVELGKIVDLYKINLQNYDRIIYLANGYTMGGCSTVGKAPVVVNGSSFNLSEFTVEGLSSYKEPSKWGSQLFPWTNLDYVLSHEMGHSLGTMHANGFGCLNSQILYGDCFHIEYGNYFDVMGMVGFSLDYNAYFKEQLGWIPASEVIKINQSGVYTIHPLKLSEGVKLAKIYPKDSTTASYAVEFRKGVGFDSNLNDPTLAENQNGILVSLIQAGDAPAVELLDMSPTHGWYESLKNATLNLPSASSSVSSFVDVGRGVTIGPILSVSSSSISFEVNIQTPLCQRLDPARGEVYYSYDVAAGGVGYVNIHPINQDYYGCGPSDFSISPTTLDSWNYTFNPIGDVTIAPSASGYKHIGFTVPLRTLPGDYNLGIDIVNKKSSLKTHVDVPIRVTQAVIKRVIIPKKDVPAELLQD